MFQLFNFKSRNLWYYLLENLDNKNYNGGDNVPLNENNKLIKVRYVSDFSNLMNTRLYHYITIGNSPKYIEFQFFRVTLYNNCP